MLIQYDLNITIKGSVTATPGKPGSNATNVIPANQGKQIGDSFDQTAKKDSSLSQGGDDSEETGPGGQPPGVPSIGIVPVIINCFCCCRPAGAGLEQQGGKPKPK